MIILREMTRADYDYCQQHEDKRGILSKMPQQTEWTYALAHEDKTLGIGGIEMVNLTTAWCWFSLTDAAHDHMRTAYRVIKEWTDILAKEHSIIRMMAFVEVGFEEGCRVMEHLNFHEECRMPKFIGDKPVIIYVKFYNW